MDRNALRAVITGVLLVPLAWVLIAAALKQHEGSHPSVLVWGALFVIDLGIAVYSALHWQRTKARRPRG